MYDFHPYYTNDGSIGLYNTDYNDIYHSATGALTEAYEKFVYPIDFDKLITKDEIKVLDICYGIGYNTKSFLNYIFDNYLSKKFSKKLIHAKTYTEQIYTNKSIDILSSYNDKIYSDNMLPKISITTLDNDKILTLLSPFIKTGEKHINNNNINFEYNRINKFLKNNNKKCTYKIKKIINFLILYELLSKNSDIFTEYDFINILFNKKYSLYFDSELKGIFANLLANYNKVVPSVNKLTFLHNIYYNHVSNKYIKALKRYSLQHVDIQFNIDDARHYILNNCNTYNVIFLDAFTPSKCPCLWSYEFFSQLYQHLEQDGILLTYSTSASIRGAMQEAGFYIGNIKSPNNLKVIGTFASKEKNLIKFPLSEYDLGLIKTRAGIFYRDKNLTMLNNEIIDVRNHEVETSDRITCSQYKKHNCRKY